MTSTTPGHPPHRSPDRGRRLDSWKEIASHLGREVRTVQRWEQSEGLPVHRHRHDRGVSVHAYETELDVWLARRSPAAEPEPAPAAPHERAGWMWAVAAVLGLGLAAGFLTWRQVASPEPLATAAAERPQRLAVLPFQDLGPEADDGRLADGLTEELILRIGQLDTDRLQVIGRTSAMRYRNTERSATELAEELGVDFLLEGSVRREGDAFRITARLLNGDAQVWSRAYDARAQEMLRLQQHVADDVARALEITLTPALSPDEARAPAVDPKAYDTYLGARYLWHQSTPDSLQRSLTLFERATELAPGFAAAHAGLAETYNRMGHLGLGAPRTVYPKARAAAERALELDPRSADAQAARATAVYAFDWQIEDAEAGYRKALELNPGRAATHHAYAHLLSTQGRHDEALAALRRAQTLEPFSAAITSDGGWFFYRARRYGEAIRECQKVLAMEPASFGATVCIVASLQKQERHAEARAAAVAGLRELGQADLAEQAEAMGAEEALEWLDRRRLAMLRRVQSQGTYVSPSTFALQYATLGETDLTFEALERAMQERDRGLLLVRVHPYYDGLRKDPRYLDLLRRAGL